MKALVYDGARNATVKSVPDGGSAIMTAQLASLDASNLAHLNKAGVILDGSMRRGAGDKPQIVATRFDCGYVSPYFGTDPERMEVVLENVYILIREQTISSKKDLLPLLEDVIKSGRPLLIIAEDIGGEALANLVVNKLRGALQVAAVRAPGCGDQRKSTFQQIALFTGGKTISDGLDIELQSIKISDLGQAKKVTVDKNSTVIEETEVPSTVCASRSAVTKTSVLAAGLETRT
jgi:chaperonin GroEL